MREYWNGSSKTRWNTQLKLTTICRKSMSFIQFSKFTSKQFPYFVGFFFPFLFFNFFWLLLTIMAVLVCPFLLFYPAESKTHSKEKKKKNNFWRKKSTKQSKNIKFSTFYFWIYQVFTYLYTWLCEVQVWLWYVFECVRVCVRTKHPNRKWNTWNGPFQCDP